MEKFNVDTINKISISGTGSFCYAVKPLWLIATDSQNTYTLNCRNHNHAFYELHIITGGKLAYSFGTSELELYESDFTIIPPHHRHKVMSHSESIGKFTIAFELDEGFDITSAIKSMSCKKNTLSKGASLHFQRIIALCGSKKEFKSEQIYLSICNLIFEIAELSEVSGKPKIHRPESDDRVFKAKKYIEDNFDIFFSCAEVAAYCRISEKQLGRLFLKHEGIGLLPFIHAKKMEAISKMLSRKNSTHTQTAQQLGFSSVQYYGKFIQRMTGMTPEQYKKHLEKM